MRTRRVVRNGAVVAEGYDFTETTPLSTYAARPSGKGIKGFPEVVFAATANLSGEKLAPLDGVPYTFSGEWVGGPDLGYMRTSDLCSATAKTHLGRDLTVEAAVAVSGAAFASSMGRAGRWYSTLFAVTGLRLGTWLPNPRFVRERATAIANDDWTVPELPRLRRLSTLMREVFRLHPHEAPLLHITDGGHYENLGLVELFRRRCTEIYCIDSSGDSPPTAGTLEQAITLAWTELGVQIIKLDDAMWDTSPGTGKAYEPAAVFAALNQRLSKRAVVKVTIRYPEESGLDETTREGSLIFREDLAHARNGLRPPVVRGAERDLSPRLDQRSVLRRRQVLRVPRARCRTGQDGGGDRAFG